MGERRRNFLFPRIPEIHLSIGPSSRASRHARSPSPRALAVSPNGKISSLLWRLARAPSGPLSHRDANRETTTKPHRACVQTQIRKHTNSRLFNRKPIAPALLPVVLYASPVLVQMVPLLIFVTPILVPFSQQRLRYGRSRRRRGLCRGPRCSSRRALACLLGRTVFLAWLGIRRGTVGCPGSLRTGLALAEARREARSEAHGRFGTKRCGLLARLFVLCTQVLWNNSPTSFRVGDELKTSHPPMHGSWPRYEEGRPSYAHESRFRWA